MENIKSFLESKINESTNSSYPISVSKLSTEPNIEKGRKLGSYTILKTFDNLSFSDINSKKWQDHAIKLKKTPLSVGDKFKSDNKSMLFNIVPCTIIGIVEVTDKGYWEDGHYIVIFKTENNTYGTDVNEFLSMYTIKIK